VQDHLPRPVAGQQACGQQQVADQLRPGVVQEQVHPAGGQQPVRRFKGVVDEQFMLLMLQELPAVLAGQAVHAQVHAVAPQAGQQELGHRGRRRLVLLRVRRRPQAGG
jgi:hypothetical protein